MSESATTHTGTRRWLKNLFFPQGKKKESEPTQPPAGYKYLGEKAKDIVSFMTDFSAENNPDSPLPQDIYQHTKEVISSLRGSDRKQAKEFIQGELIPAFEDAMDVAREKGKPAIIKCLKLYLNFPVFPKLSDFLKSPTNTIARLEKIAAIIEDSKLSPVQAIASLVLREAIDQYEADKAAGSETEVFTPEEVKDWIERNLFNPFPEKENYGKLVLVPA